MGWLISRLDMAEKRNLELEDTSRETFKTEMQKEKILGNKSTQNRMSKHCGTTIKSITLYNGNIRRRQRTEAISEAITTENFPKLMSDTKPQI